MNDDFSWVRFIAVVVIAALCIGGACYHQSEMNRRCLETVRPDCRDGEAWYDGDGECECITASDDEREWHISGGCGMVFFED